MNVVSLPSGAKILPKILAIIVCGVIGYLPYSYIQLLLLEEVTSQGTNDPLPSLLLVGTQATTLATRTKDEALLEKTANGDDGSGIERSVKRSELSVMPYDI